MSDVLIDPYAEMVIVETIMDIDEVVSPVIHSYVEVEMYEL